MFRWHQIWTVKCQTKTQQYISLRQNNIRFKRINKLDLIFGKLRVLKFKSHVFYLFSFL